MTSPILFDVDGVLASFVQGMLDFVNRRDDSVITLIDVTDDLRLYDFWDEECENHARSSGFAKTLKPIPEGCKAVEELLSRGEKIVFVTSPYGEAPTWCHDRTKWLESTFGVTRNDVIFARSKQYVDGITLIDDLPRNIFNWQKYWNRSGFLVHQPQNYENNYEDATFKFDRVEKTEEILAAIERAKHEYSQR